LLCTLCKLFPLILSHFEHEPGSVSSNGVPELSLVAREILEEACYFGRMEIVKLFIEEGVVDSQFSELTLPQLVTTNK
jgi:hypothetical protein